MTSVINTTPPAGAARQCGGIHAAEFGERAAAVRYVASLVVEKLQSQSGQGTGTAVCRGGATQADHQGRVRPPAKAASMTSPRPRVVAPRASSSVMRGSPLDWATSMTAVPSGSCSHSAEVGR